MDRKILGVVVDGPWEHRCELDFTNIDGPLLDQCDIAFQHITETLKEKMQHATEQI